MTPEKFNEIVDKRLSKCRETLTVKAGEYASEQDRLHNFKRAGDMQNISDAEALRGMWAKHLVSVMDIIEQVAAGGCPEPELWEEKAKDTINYVLLLEGLIEDQR